MFWGEHESDKELSGEFGDFLKFRAELGFLAIIIKVNMDALIV
jgi:hypothetical protein